MWVLDQKYVQFDIETDITTIREQKIITVQFGSVNKPKKVQYVFQWSHLTDVQKKTIKYILEDKLVCKIIHNAKFEISRMLNVGIRIRNVYCTMLCERIIYTGFEDSDMMSSALVAVAERRLFLELDKTEQTNFGDNIITEKKVIYAAQDVKHLDAIRNLQLIELHRSDLEYVAALECEAVIGFAQMEWEGMELNKEKWLENLDMAMPVIEQAEAECNEWLDKEPFASMAAKLGYVNTEDKLQLNWNSNDHKRMVVAKIWPGAPGATKAVLTKYCGTIDGDPYQNLLRVYLQGDYKTVEEYLITYERDWLIENDLLWPANTSKINWNSVDQVLPLLKVVDKNLQNMNAESMGRFAHPIGESISGYKDALKLSSTYGSAFFEHVHPDGKVRTQFSQILSTGRVSSKEPNMQQVPAKEHLKDRYRNAFVPPFGMVFVSGDYASQELVNIATLSRDKNWTEALKKGHDLHSLAAELVFRDKFNPWRISWKETAEKTCAYYHMSVGSDGKLQMDKQKCSCKIHKVMRTACKSINFGLAFGMTEYKLASMLRIGVGEAKRLIMDYYVAMPAIGKTMTFLGNLAVRRGYSTTMAPFFRRRYYPSWRLRRQYIDEHIKGIRTDSWLGAIERAGKNQPIQGSAADQTKTAICLVMWELDEHDLHDTVKLVMQVHDQLDTCTLKDFAPKWRIRLKDLMEEAALINIPSGLLKAEVTITDVWSK